MNLDQQINKIERLEIYLHELRNQLRIGIGLMKTKIKFEIKRELKKIFKKMNY